MSTSEEEERQLQLRVARELLCDHADVRRHDMSRAVWEESVADLPEAKLVGPRVIEAIGSIVFVGNKRRVRR